MSALSVAWSLLGGSVFLAAGLMVSVTLRRLFFPGWRGTLAVTTVALLWLCWALALGQLLGAVGLLRQMALLGSAVLSAAATMALARAFASHDREHTTVQSSDVTVTSPGEEPAAERAIAGTRGELALTVGTVLLALLVAAIWIARTVIALHRGMNDPDSLAYHLPFAVTFSQSGYADQHRLLVPLLPVQFFPAHDELLSAIALTLTHSVAFAAVKNLVYGGLVVVAAHALGKAFGAARLNVCASAVVLGFPVVAFSQPGEAVNDTLLLLVLVGALAVLAHVWDRPAPYVLALACAGLALGVKFSGVVPGTIIAVLALTLLLARVPSHRWRWAGVGLLTSAAMGGSWYVRNAVRYGNPVPPVQLSLGPIHLHKIHGLATDLSFSVAHYAAHGRLLGIFARGLVRGLGPLVAVIAALCLLGVGGGLRSGDGFRRGLSIVAAVALVGYLVTPASAYGPVAQVAESFVINLHYAAPPLLFGMLAAAVALARWRGAWTIPVVGIVAVATGIGRGRGIAYWSPEVGGLGLALLLGAAVVGAAVCVARLRPSLRVFAWPGTVLAAVIAVAAVAVIVSRYPARRTTDPVLRWAATTHKARIVLWVGDVPDLINLGNLYGPQARNRVVDMNRLVDGAAVPIDSCVGLKQAVRDGHFEYTAVTSGTPGFGWLQADPAFRIVADETVGASVSDLRYLRRYRGRVSNRRPT